MADSLLADSVEVSYRQTNPARHSGLPGGWAGRPVRIGGFEPTVMTQTGLGRVVEREHPALSRAPTGGPVKMPARSRVLESPRTPRAGCARRGFAARWSVPGSG